MSPEITGNDCQTANRSKSLDFHKYPPHPSLLYHTHLCHEFTAKYDVESVIGWGGFGTVRKVKSKEYETLSLACKFILKSKVSPLRIDASTNLPLEVIILKKVSCINLKT
jgi:hypothetical protein